MGDDLELVPPPSSDAKRCVTCKLLKPLADFNVRRASPDGRQPSCRECNRAWHAANKEDHNRLIRARARRYKAALQQRIIEYLLEHPCVDCGEDDIVVLEFDHVRGEKVAAVTTLVGSLEPWARVAAEIAKCDVRCANCHRRRTAERAGSYRTRRPR